MKLSELIDQQRLGDGEVGYQIRLFRITLRSVHTYRLSTGVIVVEMSNEEEEPCASSAEAYGETIVPLDEGKSYKIRSWI